MANIGDLMMRVVADMKGFSTTVTKEAEKTGDKAGKKLASGLGSSLKGGILGGLGLGVGLGAVQVATRAIGELTDVMGDAVTAAQEEEKSIAKLDAALRANIDGWDGNTDAIEETLAARMRLGFADDEQRESLALLVAATKDYNKALEVQRTAMDLARLKGITLKEASEALVKVEAGQFRILKSLGIQLPKNAKAEDALAAVQKVSAGQAEAYARTNEGKLLASQIKVGEAMERLGAVVLPLVTEGAAAAADVIEDLVDAFDELRDALDDTGGTARDNAEPLGNLANILDDLGQRGEDSKTFIGALDEALSDLIEDSADVITFWDGWTLKAHEGEQAITSVADTTKLRADEISDSYTGVRDITELRSDEIAEAYGRVATAATDMATDTSTATAKAGRSFKDYVDAAIAEAGRLIDDALGPVQRAQEVTALQQELADQRKILSDKDANAAAKREAKQRITDIEANLLKTRTQQAALGELSNKELKRLGDDLQRAVNRSTGKTKGEWQDLLNWFRRNFGNLSADVRITTRATRSGPLERATGGPLEAFQPAIVGEHRPELFIPEVPGYVHPTVESGLRALGGPEGGTVINLETYGLPMRAETPLEVALQLRRVGSGNMQPYRSAGWRRTG